MQLKTIKIGNVETKNNLFLAPLAGYTDFAFRGICSEFGAGLTVTEMVSAKGLIYNNKGTTDLLKISKKEDVVAVQLFGHEPEVMRNAAQSEALKDFKIIDINMGCPVPKVYNNGDGSALLNDLLLAEKVISETAKSGKEITVKIRTGLTEDKLITRDFAVMCENAGASLITIHGRIRPAYYSGEVNYSEIEKAKNSVKIPVIANGGIFSKEDAENLMDRTGADGVMLARGALSKPWLFSEISNKKVDIDLKVVVKAHIDGLKSYYEDKYVAIVMRKMMPYYLKNLVCSKELKHKFVLSSSTEETLNLLDVALKEHTLNQK